MKNTKNLPELGLGVEAECTVSGFKGIATSKTEYLTGCIHYGLCPKVDENGNMKQPESFDANSLKVIGWGVVPKVPVKETKKKDPPGGPQRAVRVNH